jgi:hypothetical protein
MNLSPPRRVRRTLAVVVFGLAALVQASWAAAAPPDMHARLAELSHGFMFDGKPVPPRLIQQFEGLISDGTEPIIITVDLAEAVGSNQFDSEDVERRNGAFVVHGPDPDATFSYEWLGTVRPNVHVLTLDDAPGGTGVFGMLLILKAEVHRATGMDGKPYDQLLLTFVRSYDLGDRDDGKVKVLPGRVIISKSRYRTKPVTLSIPGEGRTPAPSGRKAGG